jgi:CheY-like chemotaxis protein
MTKTLCIIDDDELYKLLLKKTIINLKSNTNVISFANGEEAIYGLLENKSEPSKLPDTILLDINMPVMDGWEFMEHFLNIQKEFSKPIVIYIASSSIANQDIEKSKTYKEISGYLVKPIVKSTVVSLLNGNGVL